MGLLSRPYFRGSLLSKNESEICLAYEQGKKTRGKN